MKKNTVFTKVTGVLTSVVYPWHFGVVPDSDLRIHASGWWIQIQIRIRSCYFHHWPSRRLQKTNKKSFSAYYFLKVHVHHFSKIKSPKKSHNSRNEGFSYNYFCFIKQTQQKYFFDQEIGFVSISSVKVFFPTCMILKNDLGDEHNFCTTLMEKTLGRIGILQ